MIIINTTNIFDKWLKKLKDHKAKSVISTHIDRMEDENLGNTRNVGDGVWEKKISYGAGYRLYYCQKGEQWILLLCGGDKSTQQKDIKQAKEIKKGLK